MTEEEQRLADDKMRAEIADYWVQARKLDRDRYWYPAVLMFGAAGAGAAIARLSL